MSDFVFDEPSGSVRRQMPLIEQFFVADVLNGALSPIAARGNGREVQGNAADIGAQVAVAGMVAGDGMAYKLTPFGAQIDEQKALALINDFFGDLAEEALSVYDLNKQFPDMTFTQMGHDAFLASLYMFGDTRRDRNSGNTYIYEFVHVMPGKDSEMFGAFHSSDMPYFWNIFSDERKDAWTQADRELGEKLCKALVSFAASGRTDDSGGWEPYSGTYCCNIGINGYEKSIMNEKKLLFWKKTINSKVKIKELISGGVK